MKTFEELGVMPEICEAISEMGFEHPMPVQEEVIPYLLGNGNDAVTVLVGGFQFCAGGDIMQPLTHFIFQICIGG